MKKMAHNIYQLSIIAILLSFPASVLAQNKALPNHQLLKTTTFSSVEQKAVHPLTIGDKVPDVIIDNIINYSSSRARLSDFSGKLVIIDFWGTSCASCISALPKIDSLQRQFKNRLQVFAVTNFDTKEKVEKTLHRFKNTQNLQFPIVLNNDLLKEFFPHEIISHVVWINGEGIVKAITGTEYINAKNIQAILDGRKVKWPVKKDISDFNYEKPFLDFSQANVTRPGFLYYSALTGYIDGIDGTDKIIIDSAKQTITKNYFNHSLLQLCAGSLIGSGNGYIHPKKLILQVTDPRRYILSDQYKAEWEKKNAYCYSITLPFSYSKEEISRIIKEDLTHWLNVIGISVKKEIRQVNCLILVRTKQNDSLLKTKGDEYYYGLNEAGKVKRITNSPISNLTWHLNEETMNIPWVFDETGIAQSLKIDMELNIDSFENIPALRKELQRYGLDLIKAKRPLEMYSIREKEFADTTVNNKELD